MNVPATARSDAQVDSGNQIRGKNASIPKRRYTKRPDRPPGPPVPDEWRRVFLEAVKRTGGIFKAAEAAGVHPKTATRHLNADPEFREEVDFARQYHADHLEESLEKQADRTDSPVGYIVRLKALRPNEYIEKHAVMNVNATVNLSEADGRALLQAMLSHRLPSGGTQAELPPASESG